MCRNVPTCVGNFSAIVSTHHEQCNIFLQDLHVSCTLKVSVKLRKIKWHGVKLIIRVRGHLDLSIP